ncbi:MULTISPECIES: hypothetical protein [Pimelobacter]|uniref:hypothetical protein n=1 Tax=Pimelobacter TaxID=2044 RepID=UPI001C05AC1A|nr:MULTISPECIES: hypothetical protein [Pimelobacter]MBU2698833.1 hypothetical protein [Pimelobacter sp. 30-1]UUW93023.1 hypothetical protein M0M43_30485 [Pimelobacter simplex]UUW99056.1 hypothetical protein M0M48_30505 [Pimelobacter simplex]
MTQITALAANLVPMVLPPGMEKLSVLGAWTTGIVAFLLFIAFLVSIGMTGWGALSRGHFEGGKASVIILMCAIVLGSATAIFTTFAVIG